MTQNIQGPELLRHIHAKIDVHELTFFFHDWWLCCQRNWNKFRKLLYSNMDFNIFNVNFRSGNGRCSDRRRRGKKEREQYHRSSYTYHSVNDMHNPEVIPYLFKTNWLTQMIRWVTSISQTYTASYTTKKIEKVSERFNYRRHTLDRIYSTSFFLFLIMTEGASIPKTTWDHSMTWGLYFAYGTHNDTYIRRWIGHHWFR